MILVSRETRTRLAWIFCPPLPPCGVEDYKSALSQHQLQTGHRVTTQPILDTIKIIDQEARNAHRKIKEAIHIQLVGAKLNRNEGWELPKPYLPLLRKEAEGGRRSTQVSS
ncbi:hypothetical protein Bbelb_073730 [Branchiostoma belcheri]|nr:hypothetical protein Bbelb_073730 [Branchiostoma belcheri]